MLFLAVLVFSPFVYYYLHLLIIINTYRKHLYFYLHIWKYQCGRIGEVTRGQRRIEPGDINTNFNDAMDFGNHRDSPYGERILRCEAVIRELLPKAPGPEIVARAIERALTARWPRVRYAVGPDSWGTTFARRCLPDSLFLRFIRSHFKV